jgi:hypothetical protein
MKCAKHEAYVSNTCNANSVRLVRMNLMLDKVRFTHVYIFIFVYLFQLMPLFNNSLLQRRNDETRRQQHVASENVHQRECVCVSY